MLEIKHLQKQYHPNEEAALKDISLTIRQGEFVAVLGLSGAGKSTLIRCINRLVEPTKGNLTWNGEDILNKKGRNLRLYRKSIGMIFQSFHLIDRFDTITNVLVGRLGDIPLWRACLLRFTEDERADALQALRRVGLEEMANRRASQLSGGQRQRVAIARALVQKPKMILGDEPVASLDPLTSRSVMDLLTKINHEDNITMLINLHDVELAKEYATRVIGIANGRIVFDGTPNQLTQKDLAKIYSQVVSTPVHALG